MKNIVSESSDLIILSLIGTFSATGLAIASTQVTAQQTSFPDVSPQYWASPFIRVLAKEGIVSGYPDGTFRPKKVIDRDEFAAIIRQAFNRKQVKSIPNGSSFDDVPKGYWAAPPIEEAYESGFMKASSENKFRPQQKLSKVEALVALIKGLNLSYQPSRKVAIANPQSRSAQQSKSRKASRKAKRGLMFPLASTALLQPFYQQSLNNSNNNQSDKTTTTNTAKKQQVSTESSAKEMLKMYYQDANKIPNNAINEVAAATQADIVVNYPKTQFLNPTQSVTRGGAAALIHQALVSRGKLTPIDSEVKASNYIINYPAKN